MKKKARVIAWYLPQYHPIKENNETWGKGFTEWNNVVKAKPFFKGHYQPKLPADLGFYDLRIPEVREEQAKLAIEAGVEGFMYWHYWFGDGKMLLEKPLEWVLKSNRPNFPFCFGWANHSWSNKTWIREKKSTAIRMIAEMKYLGESDNLKHFEYCLPFFQDSRYIRIENKPLFIIYSPQTFIALEEFIDQWNRLAKINGLEGIYFVAIKRFNKYTYEELKQIGFDGICNNERQNAESFAIGNNFSWRLHRFLSRHNLALNKYDYRKVMSHFYSDDNYKLDCYPVITPGFDRTPRAGKKGEIYHHATPEAFKAHVHNTLEYVKNKDTDHKIIFLDSWNEWGEGNYMEPDQKFGHGFIDALKSEIFE